VGGLVVLVLRCLDSQPLPNKSGRNPKALGAPTAHSPFTMQ
jgi:hypothetical protein